MRKYMMDFPGWSLVVGPLFHAFRGLFVPISKVGGAQPGNRFVSFVRVYARSGSEVGLGKNRSVRTCSLFPLGVRWFSFEFCVVLVSPGEI